MFSESFLQILIIAALCGISIASITLITMLINDIKERNVW